MIPLSQSASVLRAEARLLATAGFILLGAGFPLTLALAALALAPDGLSPWLAPALGGPPILLGYVACHFASARLARAKALEQGAPSHSRNALA